MTRIAWIAIGVAGCGAALVVAGVIVGRPVVVVEGAYFNRSVGSAPGLFDPADGNLWIGAGIMALVAAVALAALAFVRRSR